MQFGDLARLIVKIAGLVVIIFALADLPYSLGRVLVMPEKNGLDVLSMGLAPVLIPMFAGLWMFFGTGAIVDRLVTAVPTSEPSDFSKIEEILIAVLGIYMLGQGLANGAYLWGELYLAFRMTSSYPTPSLLPETWGGVISAAVEIVIGVVLLLFSRGIAAARRRLLSFRPLSGANN